MVVFFEHMSGKCQSIVMQHKYRVLKSMNALKCRTFGAISSYQCQYTTKVDQWQLTKLNFRPTFFSIRESVDSLCRDGDDTDTPINQEKRLKIPERYSYKPFQTHNRVYECFYTRYDPQSM